MIVFLDALIIVAIVLIVYAFFTQVFTPIYMGTAMFPMFRKEAQIKKDLTEARQDLEETRLEKDVEKVKEEIKKEKGGTENADAKGTDSKLN